MYSTSMKKLKLFHQIGSAAAASTTNNAPATSHLFEASATSNVHRHRQSFSSSTRSPAVVVTPFELPSIQSPGFQRQHRKSISAHFREQLAASEDILGRAKPSFQFHSVAPLELGPKISPEAAKDNGDIVPPAPLEFAFSPVNPVSLAPTTINTPHLSPGASCQDHVSIVKTQPPSSQCRLPGGFFTLTPDDPHPAICLPHSTTQTSFNEIEPKRSLTVESVSRLDNDHEGVRRFRWKRLLSFVVEQPDELLTITRADANSAPKRRPYSSPSLPVPEISKMHNSSPEDFFGTWNSSSSRHEASSVPKFADNIENGWGAKEAVEARWISEEKARLDTDDRGGLWDGGSVGTDGVNEFIYDDDLAEILQQQKQAQAPARQAVLNSAALAAQNKFWEPLLRKREPEIIRQQLEAARKAARAIMKGVSPAEEGIFRFDNDDVSPNGLINRKPSMPAFKTMSRDFGHYYSHEIKVGHDTPKPLHKLATDYNTAPQPLEIQVKTSDNSAGRVRAQLPMRNDFWEQRIGLGMNDWI